MRELIDGIWIYLMSVGVMVANFLLPALCIAYMVDKMGEVRRRRDARRKGNRDTLFPF